MLIKIYNKMFISCNELFVIWRLKNIENGIGEKGWSHCLPRIMESGDVRSWHDWVKKGQFQATIRIRGTVLKFWGFSKGSWTEDWSIFKELVEAVGCRNTKNNQLCIFFFLSSLPESCHITNVFQDNLRHCICRIPCATAQS